jgi:hypothetical protein
VNIFNNHRFTTFSCKSRSTFSKFIGRNLFLLRS